MVHVASKSAHFPIVLMLFLLCSCIVAQEKNCSTIIDEPTRVRCTKKRILPDWHVESFRNGDPNGYEADLDESSFSDYDASDDSSFYESNDYSSSYDSDNDDLQFAFDEDLKNFEDKGDLNAWERQRLFRRLIKGIEELKHQLAQEQLELLAACQEVARASENTITTHTAKLEAMVEAMQKQLNDLTLQVADFERNIIFFNQSSKE